MGVDRETGRWGPDYRGRDSGRDVKGLRKQGEGAPGRVVENEKDGEPCLEDRTSRRK